MKRALWSQISKAKLRLLYCKDARGWGNKSGIYTTSAGYNIISNPHPFDNSDIWKSVWAVKSLPKVDFFIWTLAHGEILTGHGLKKRGGKALQDACFVWTMKKRLSTYWSRAHLLKRSGKQLFRVMLNFHWTTFIPCLSTGIPTPLSPILKTR